MGFEGLGHLFLRKSRLGFVFRCVFVKLSSIPDFGTLSRDVFSTFSGSSHAERSLLRHFGPMNPAPQRYSLGGCRVRCRIVAEPGQNHKKNSFSMKSQNEPTMSSNENPFFRGRGHWGTRGTPTTGEICPGPVPTPTWAEI